MLKNRARTILILLVLAAAGGLCISAAEQTGPPPKATVKAAVIVCKGMIDDGLYQSIRRRTELALKEGDTYLIYEIETYGGLLEAGDNISKYFILEVADKAHTVAYVSTEAISAGAMIAVSCRDIIMRKNTTIGDCAPIQLGGKLEGVEREKAESFVRATFMRAAEANHYPKALLKAMVSISTEVYRVKNIETGQYEFFETEDLPKDTDVYDIENKELIVKDSELLTLTASKAAEYGIARAVVEDVNGALEFVAKRDGVVFSGPPTVLETNWSEDMVRWLNSPVLMGLLLMVGLLALYVEFHTPGLGLAGLVALICFAILIGSKYLVGMANWVEIALFIVGVLLLLTELFLIPGFGLVGFAGILCIMLGLFGMLIKNPPGRFPWPQNAFDWQQLTYGLLSVLFGFAGFVILAILLGKFLPKVGFLSGLILLPTPAKKGDEFEISMTAPPEQGQAKVQVGQTGEATSRLRPAGKARFDDAVVDVVAEGEFIDKGAKVRIIEIHGNRVVVKAME